MKHLLPLLLFALLMQTNASAQIEFILDPSQSMLMTGKGAGQDATINPYVGQDCVAIVENIGQREFSIRIQRRGKILREIAVPKGASKKIKLMAGEELYLDPNPTGVAKARVDYAKLLDE